MTSGACGQELQIDMIRRKLNEYAERPVVPPAGEKYRQAAVMILLTCCQDEWHLLYTRRTEHVQSHKGQVSFPGGAVEPDDLSRQETALRETFEEIGIAPSQIDVLGCLWEMPTITGFMITPVVGTISWPVAFNLSPDEVSRAFIVPMRWLADPSHHEEVDLHLPDGRHEKVIYFKEYDGERIWGATARITLNFLKILGLR